MAGKRTRPASLPAKKELPLAERKPDSTLLTAEIILRSSSAIARRFVEKSLLKNKYGGETADEVLARQSRTMSLAAIVLSRVATKSTPGALIVGGGLLAKGLFNRAGTYRKQRRMARNRPPKG